MVLTSVKGRTDLPRYFAHKVIRLADIARRVQNIAMCFVHSGHGLAERIRPAKIVAGVGEQGIDARLVGCLVLQQQVSDAAIGRDEENPIVGIVAAIQEQRVQKLCRAAHRRAAKLFNGMRICIYFICPSFVGGAFSYKCENAHAGAALQRGAPPPARSDFGSCRSVSRQQHKSRLPDEPHCPRRAG